MYERVEIAGVAFETHWPQALRIRRIDRVYEAFVGTRSAIISPRVPIGVTVSDTLPPVLPATAAVTSGGATWSLLREGSERYFVSPAGATAQPAFWTMRIRPTPLQADIWMGPRFRSATPDGAPHYFNPVTYPVDQLLLIHALSLNEGLLVHAAGVVLDGVGLVFPGVSGAGKSTLARQFQRTGHGDALLSDDRVVLRATGAGWHACGTPWPGNAGVARNAAAPLHALAFLTQGSAHKLRRLSPLEALERLIPVTSIPWYDAELVGPVLATCDRLLREVLCYELTCTPTPDVLDAVRAMLPRADAAGMPIPRGEGQPAT